MHTLLRRLHSDERGAVSLETILILGAIALPILIFVLKYGWPRVRNYFTTGQTKLEKESNDVISGVSNN
jgi:Flp pilus assembly pilin Flp